MSLQNYFDAFRTGYWATDDVATCPCHGHGWALSEVDTWHTCPVHFCGQLAPEDDGGSSEEWEAADHLSRVEWAVKHGRASFTREEAARRAPPPPVPAPALADDEIPF